MIQDFAATVDLIVEDVVRLNMIRSFVTQGSTPGIVPLHG
jgi:hypothetical protein